MIAKMILHYIFPFRDSIRQSGSLRKRQDNKTVRKDIEAEIIFAKQLFYIFKEDLLFCNVSYFWQLPTCDVLHIPFKVLKQNCNTYITPISVCF